MILSRMLLLALCVLTLGACEKAAAPPAPVAIAPEASAPAAPPAAPAAEELMLTVGPERVACTGVSPQTCLRVRSKPGGDWELLYDTIEGFDHEPGFETSIIVRREPVENPPADASAFRWVLVQVIGRRPLIVPPY